MILYPDLFLAKQEKIHQHFFSASETGYMYLRLLHTAEYLYKHRITITKKSGPGYRVRQIRSWLEFKFLKYILESSTGTKSAKRILSHSSKHSNKVPNPSQKAFLALADFWPHFQTFTFGLGGGF